MLRKLISRFVHWYAARHDCTVVANHRLKNLAVSVGEIGGYVRRSGWLNDPGTGQKIHAARDKLGAMATACMKDAQAIGTDSMEVV